MVEIRWDEGGIDALMDEIETECQRRAVKVVRAAKRLSPVDTGRLRSSITSDKPERRGRTTVVVRVGTNVDYAKYVELGTSRMRAQPFLRPGLDAAR